MLRGCRHVLGEPNPVPLSMGCAALPAPPHRQVQGSARVVRADFEHITTALADVSTTPPDVGAISDELCS